MIRSLVLTSFLFACGGSHKSAQAPSSAVPVDPLTKLCMSTGGTVGRASCCGDVSDFPDQTGVGACGCAPASSHTVKVCECPGIERFSRTKGCK